MTPQSFRKSWLELQPSQRVVVGVSGGRDSICLLHLLHQVHCTGLIVAHVNHQLRPEADAEMFLVEQVAMQLGVIFEGRSIDVASLAKERGQSVELAAREARLAFFAELAMKHSTQDVALAHHAEDQAETILFQTLRGSGLRGLAGMQVVSRHSSLRLLRPLLNTRRAEIDSYLTEHGLPYAEDSSNAELKHSRNRVRHILIPAVKEALQRDPVPALLRLGSIAQREDAYLHEQALSLITVASDASLLLTPELRFAAPALQYRALRHWLKEVHQVPDLDAEVIEAAVSLLHQLEPARINLPGAQQLRRKEGKLWISPMG
jgi:tRNA(Ile)-lysidine synthase